MTAIAFATLSHVSNFLYHGKFLANTPFVVAAVYLVLALRVVSLLRYAFSGDLLRAGHIAGAIRVFGPPEAILMFLIILPGAYVYSGAGGYPEPGHPFPASLKAGALLSILLYLVMQLVDVLCRPRVIDRLVHVRRELVSRRLSPQEALDQLEAIGPLIGGNCSPEN